MAGSTSSISLCGNLSGCVCIPGVTLACPGDCSNCNFSQPDSCAFLPPGDVEDELKSKNKEGDVNCFCTGEFVKLCEGNCESCENYPFETCAYPNQQVDEGAEGMRQQRQEAPIIGICVSTYTVFEKKFIESGCDSFANLTTITVTPNPTPSTTTTDSSSDTDSPDVVTSTSSPNDNDPVCIDANALAHLSFPDLVYSSHRRASVLCDTFGSCATPGHVVVYNERVMTMRMYCGVTMEGCRSRVKFVNSPRMRVKEGRVRVESKSPGLEYTVLAAKYETRLEMSVLRLVVGIGF